MPAISGIVKDASGTPCAALIRVLRRDTMALVGQVFSGASTGAYSITTADTTPHVVERYVASVGNIDFGSMVFGCHFNGSNGSTTFTDVKGHTLTANGNAQISTAVSQFGGASLYLDGNGDYVEIAPLSSELDFGGGPLTIRFWTDCQDQTTSYPSIISTQGGWSAGSLSIRFDNAGYASKFSVHLNGATPGDPFLVSSSTYSFDTLRQVEFSRDSYGACRLFVGGALAASGTYYGPINLAMGGSARIGWSTWDGASGYYKGHIDEMEIHNTCLHTTGFTPPSSAFIDYLIGTPTENAQIFDYVTPV